MEDWRSNPGAKPHRDVTMGRLPKLAVTTTKSKPRPDPELVKNALAMSDQLDVLDLVVQKEGGGSGSGNFGGASGDDKGKSESKMKGLMIDLNEPIETMDVGALLARPPPPFSPPPAPPVEDERLAEILKVVKRFGMDLNLADDQEGLQMGEEQGWLGQKGFPIPVMSNLGGPTGEAAGNSSSGGIYRPKPCVLFTPNVPPAPIPPPPEGIHNQLYDPSRLVRVAVNLRPAPTLWLAGTLWKLNVQREEILINCDCHSSWMECVDFLNHAGWGCIRDPEKYFKYSN